MISTIERDLKVIDGALTLVPKEYPNWYGIKDIGFIWHGAWSDPEIEYKGRVLNSTIVEDTMWERYCEDCELDGTTPNDDEFELYMKTNTYEVYELIELALGGC